MKAVGNLYLVGPMGAGKSTIGRKLAHALHMQFLDSDREIEQRTGANIPLIFELEGEGGFRAREKRMIERLTAIDNVVLATGGGAILDPQNRTMLSQHGQVIYLYASVDQQLQRTARDQHRPLLQTADPRQRLERLLADRDPLYREIARLVINTDGRSVHGVVKEILKHLGLGTPTGSGRSSEQPPQNRPRRRNPRKRR